MNTESVNKYLKNKLDELKKKLSELQDDIKSLEIEKKEVFKQIEKYKAKIDVAYEIFSPKSAKNEFVKEQIDEFEKHLNHINKQIEKKEQSFWEKGFSKGKQYDKIYLVFETTYNGKEDDIIEL